MVYATLEAWAACSPTRDRPPGVENVMQTVSGARAPAVARPGALRALVIVAHVLALSVFIQAVLAGQWLVHAGIIESHGWLGNFSFLLALVQVALVAVTGFTGRQRTVLLVATGLLVLLMTAQIGMGYAGRNSRDVAAIHLTNGVLIFGLITTTISLILRARRELAV